MKSLYTGVLMILFSVSVSYAGNELNAPKVRTDANIIGHAEDANTKEHLPYITIAVKGTATGTTTDATGHYFLKNLPAGEITLEAFAVGYKRSVKTVNVEAGKTIEINFLLEEESLIMDEVVVSATRNETNKKAAPVIVNVASAKLFESTASVNLAESMNFQPGLRVENNCGNCGITQLRINGLDGQYSQILLDSRPIFSSLAGMYGLEQLPVGMIERVEVIRGGGSALFGSSAIGGVVNIITKEPLHNTVSLTNISNILEGGRKDINTTLNGSFVTDNRRAGLYIFGMLKERDWYDRNGDGFSDIPKLSSETVGFRGYYRTGGYSRITAEYHHIHEFRRGGNNFDEPPHYADVAEQLEHNIDGGGLRFDWYTPDHRHRLNVFTSAQGIKRDSYFGVDTDPDAYGNTSDNTFVAGGQYTFAMEKFLFMPSELTAGVEYNYNDLHDRFMVFDRDLRQKTHIAGGFVQNEWKTKKLSILLGARLDKHNLMKNAVFSPRANVRYSPTDKMGFRASYSSGFRAPQAYNEDLHVDAVGGSLSVIELDTDLKPEYSHSISASADLYHNFGKLQTNLLVEGFYTLLDDVFVLEETSIDEDEGIVFYTRRNGSGAKIKGLNFELKAGMAGIFEVQAGYTYQHSRYNKPERWAEELGPQRKMFRAPDSYGYITSVFDITKNFKASLFGNYTGPMLVKHIKAEGGNEFRLENTTPAFWDMGIKLSYNFRLSANVNMELSCGIKNIFDSYQKDLDFGPLKDASYVYGPSLPRTYFFGIKFLM